MRIGLSWVWTGCTACLACSVVTPPPMTMVHDPVMRSRPGAVLVAAVGGGGGGVFLDRVAGGEGRVAVQVAEEWAIEVSGGAGARLEHHEDENIPDVLGWGRLGARFQPAGLDWFSVRFGSGGGGANTGLAYATMDAGVVFGYTWWGRMRPYAGLSGAVSLPVRQGPFIRNDLIPRRPETTLWAGMNAGITVRVAGPFEAGAEYQMVYGWSSPDEMALAFGGTGVLRYVFGTSGERPEGVSKSTTTWPLD